VVSNPGDISTFWHSPNDQCGALENRGKRQHTNPQTASANSAIRETSLRLARHRRPTRAVLATTVRGTMTQPLVNGKLELRKASINHATLPNGLSNVNGVVLFNGNSASVRDLTAESPV
jgi:hypothetical protein